MVVEQQLRAYVDYLRDMGIYDLYRREDPKVMLPEGLKERLAVARPAAPVVRSAAATQAVAAQGVGARTSVAASAAAAGAARMVSVAREAVPTAVDPEWREVESSMPKPPSLDAVGVVPAERLAAGERAVALQAVREDIGECTRCPLAYAGRRNIVFGDGDPNARLMFVGEGPGADEDETGVPFVGKAGQLLNNMITAMGLKREEVYIANIVKCRPPANRVPEFVEATTCSQFLARQIDVVRPEVIVALGATAATYLLGVKQPLASLRGQWHSVRGSKVAVTYHPAFLLRDPRQKGEAWKDLQRVMVEMGLSAPRRAT